MAEEVTKERMPESLVTKERMPESYIARIKDAAGTFAIEIGVTKDATGTVASEICVTKEAAGTFASEIGVTNMPLVGIDKPKDERNAEPLVTKERMPESYIARIKARPMRKIPDLTDDEDEAFADDPLVRALMQEGIDHINYLVDMEQDCLRQHAEKGYAEVGVYFTRGVKKMFILPN